MSHFFPHLASLLIRFLRFTYRYRYLNENLIEEVKRKHDGRYVYALWHQNIVAGLTSHFHLPHIVIVSPSRDGEIIATTCRNMGFYPVRGSSSRRGKEAIEETLELLQNKIPMANAVDGPKGPRHKVKRGVVEIAKRSHLPIVPISLIPEKYWSFEKSWDEFRLPKPFTRIGIKFGEPLYIPADTPIEKYPEYCDMVEKSLLETEKEVEQFFTK